MALFKVASLEQLPVGAMRRVEVDDDDVLLVHLEDGVHAVSDTCTHARISLADGCLEGNIVTCPKHGGKFDVQSGKAVAFPAFTALKRYDVKVDGQDIFVSIED